MRLELLHILPLLSYYLYSIEKTPLFFSYLGNTIASSSCIVVCVCALPRVLTCLFLTFYLVPMLFKLKYKKPIRFGKFRKEFIRQLIERRAQSKHTTGRLIIGDNPVRLPTWHFLSLVPATATGKIAQRACVVCNHTSRPEKKRRETRYQCDICNVGLCVMGYFEDYHTLKHFEILLYTDQGYCGLS